jgi:chromate transport protein ChrA
LENLLQLFLIFLKVNLLSTSGPASVGLLYHEMVGNYVTESQFVQAVGFSSVLPGSDALQLAMYIGYAVGGIPGGLVALLASILPPTVIILGLTVILHRLRRKPGSAVYRGSDAGNFCVDAVHGLEDFPKGRIARMGSLGDRAGQHAGNVIQKSA